MEEKIKTMKELISKLNKYSYQYYTLGNSEISDKTYDKMFDDLLELEKETNTILSNSPTQKVGNVLIEGFKKVKHEFLMKSLRKTKDVNELRSFARRADSILMHKIDGLTIDLIYNNGELINASTRGNGEVGEDITHNAKVFSNIPLKISYKEKIHVIGEAYIDYSTFEEINSKILNENDKYKNPRNLVSGTVKQLDSSICKSRKVKFIGYILEGSNLKKKDEQIEFIKHLGFESINYVKVNSNLEDQIEYMKKLANEKQIPIDGLVVCYNDIVFGKSLGQTEHHPLHSLAFKFDDDIEITKLLNVTYQVGRTGQITPVAHFEPVELEGTTVKKASIHNLSILESLKLGIGDEIAVFKANQIIPQIADNLTKSNTLKVIDKCPICGADIKIEISDASKVLVCSNKNCDARLERKIDHFCSKNAMNIYGLSKKLIAKLIDNGLLNNFMDLYKLKDHKKEILILDKVGEVSIQKILNKIEESKHCKLSAFLFGLGIPNVGNKMAKTIAKCFNNDFEKFIDASYYQLIGIPDLGDVAANSILNYFDKDSETRKEALELFELLTIEKEEIAIGNVFEGMKIYCTGSFLNYKKDELKKLIESNGGTFGYGKTIDFLVVGSKKGSSKVKDALNNGIKVITEEEFVSMLKKE